MHPTQDLRIRSYLWAGRMWVGGKKLQLEFLIITDAFN